MKRQKKGSSSLQTAQHENPTSSDDPLFFYMPDTKHGEFCQWFPSTFTVSKTQISSLIGHAIDDSPASTSASASASTPPSTSTSDSITFTHAEQFMMYCKALRFHDLPTSLLILSSPSPKEQKRLGKQTAGFSDSSWDEIKSAVVLAGTMAKFGQNAKLRGKLLGTGERLLVEAASRDRVWGIGYSAKHAVAMRRYWGENRLGRALMEVRGRLRGGGEGGGGGWG